MSAAPELSAAPVRVENLTDADEAAWEAYVDANPAATFFHRAGWRRVIGGTYGHATPYLVAKRDGRVVGVLPLVHLQSRLFGDSLISTGFCVHGGILADDGAATLALAEAAEALGRELKVAYVELRGEEAVVPGWPVKDDVYATFRKTIPEDEDENLKAIPRKKRADLRKALKSDLIVETGITPRDFWSVYAESVRNHGTPVFPLKLVEATLAEFGDVVELSRVRDDGQVYTTLLSFFFRDTVLAYHGGATPAARPSHAYDYQYWALMRRAVARGLKVFDYGRSKIGTGPYDYKRFWGFEPQPLRYQYALIGADSVPNVNPNNPKYRVMVETWRRLPLPVANRLGPPLARHLG